MSLGLFNSYASNSLPPEVTAFAITVLALLGIMSGFFWYFKGGSRSDDQPVSRFAAPRLNDLFLRVDYRLGPEEALKRGYLRSLTLDRASIVTSDKALAKGADVDLVLGPDHETTTTGAVPGKIVRKKSLGGNPESWQFDIRFAKRKEPGPNLVKDYLKKALNRDLS